MRTTKYGHIALEGDEINAVYDGLEPFVLIGYRNMKSRRRILRDRVHITFSMYDQRQHFPDELCRKIEESITNHVMRASVMSGDIDNRIQ